MRRICEVVYDSFDLGRSQRADDGVVEGAVAQYHVVQTNSEAPQVEFFALRVLLGEESKQFEQ